MIGILLVSHGKMAEGIKDSMELIMGNSDSIETSSLVAGQDFESLKADVLEKIKKLDQGKGVLVYVDLYAASPYNASMFTYPIAKEANVDIRVVTGMNLPMILETSTMRESVSLDELAEIAVKSGKEGIVEGVKQMQETVVEDELDGGY